MSILKLLGAYEHRLEEFQWNYTTWPASNAPPAGMKVERYVTQPKGSSDRLMLHRFQPDGGDGHIHPHPYALAAHVLGPGMYEVGFYHGPGDAISCKVPMMSRVLCEGEFYYEMVTSKVAHCVRPITGPIYSVALWTPFPPEIVYPERLEKGVLRDRQELLSVIEGKFNTSS